MSKTSNRQRVETLKIWIADRKIKPPDQSGKRIQMRGEPDRRG